MKKAKITVIFYPRMEKKSDRTERIPVYVRVVVQVKKAEIRTDVELNENEIKKWDNNLMRVNDRYSRANTELNRIETLFQEVIETIERNNSFFNAKIVRDLVYNKFDTTEHHVIRFAQHYYQKNVENNSEKSLGTKSNYRKAIKHLEKFLIQKKWEKLQLIQMDTSFAQDFKNYLTNNDFPNNRIGMKESSAASVIKKFRTIFDCALDRGLILKNPFKSLKLKAKSPPREKLTVEQVALIANANHLSPTQIVYRDIFLFSIYTGLAYIDAVSLTQSNMLAQKNGEVKLSINRMKTTHATEQFVISKALDIVRTYANVPAVLIRNGIIPKKSNKEINAQLKIIAEKLGIHIRLSHHIGRHTFRQLLAEAGVQDFGVIKRMMGQSREADIDHIYYTITDSRLLEAKQKFELYLNTNF